MRLFGNRHAGPTLTAEEQAQAKDLFAAKNALSIKDVPPAFITDAERASYITRALAGEDVYAYHSGPGEGVWNLWDIETRIALPLVEKVWHILSATYEGQDRWQVTVERGGQTVTVGFWIHHHAQYDATGEATYQARAPRRIKDLVNHCGAFDTDPAKYQDTHQ